MIPIGLDHLTSMAEGTPKSFMDTLPDPMKLDWMQVGFIIVLMTVLYLFLKVYFFKPVTQVVDEREAAIAAGGAAKAEAEAQVQRRQSEYSAKLRDLRAQAFAHRQALSEAATAEKNALLDQARQQANETRAQALAQLQQDKEAAKSELTAQVNALSESMVQHLLKQA